MQRTPHAPAALTILLSLTAAFPTNAQQKTPSTPQQDLAHNKQPHNEHAVRPAHNHPFPARTYSDRCACTHATPEGADALARARAHRNAAPATRITAAAGRDDGARNAFDIQFDLSPAVAADADFVAALEFGAQVWEANIKDGTTVVMSVDFVSGEPFIAAASSEFFVAPYTTWRDAVVADASPQDVSYIASLPTAPLTFDFGFLLYTPGISEPRDEVFATTAQSKSLFTPDVLPPAPIDASIVFNTDFTYDNDPNDGLTPGSVDTVFVIIHELGHSLGFISGEGSSGAVTLWDYYRVPGNAQPDNPATLAELASARRELTTGAPASVDTVNAFPSVPGLPPTPEFPLSTGTGTGGDGRQASHWKDQTLLALPNVIGVMDPTFDGGAGIDTLNPISDADRLAFSLMGWDIDLPVFTSCNTDIDADGTVNIDDLYELAQNPQDINADGITDLADYECLERSLRNDALADTSNQARP